MKVEEVFAVATEDLPADRLLCLVRPKGGDEGTVYVRLTKPGERPDFHTTRAIKEGEKFRVRVTDSKFWKAEAGEDLEAGVSVEPGADGKLLRMGNPESEGIATIGYTLHAAKSGEPVKFTAVYKVIRNRVKPEGATE